MGLFKKKDKGMSSVPPLPDDLPPVEGSNQANINNQLNPMMGQDTHSQIPNDVELNPGNNMSQDLSPDSIPDITEAPPLEEAPNPGPVTTQVEQKPIAPELPEMPNVDTSSSGLPDLPDLPSEGPENEEYTETSNEPEDNYRRPSNEDVSPDSDDDVPEPPAIFSDSKIHETPEEIKHIVEERKNYSVSNETTSFEAPGINNAGNRPESEHTKGPLFVDIESFKTMLGDVDTIKNDIRSSEVVLQHLDDIKNSKDKELERWRGQLEDIQKKINYVDKVLFNEA